jgi:uncharacterized protein (DUF488 family)
MPKKPASPTVLTVGHSTRPIDEFIDLLRAHGVNRLADVRTIPRSRRNPQFEKDALQKSLKKAGIGYLHVKGLGGLRRPKPDSVNMEWRNANFRGYADHMLTPEFERSLGRVIRLAARHRVAVMCAEAVPWRCHRSLIGDALLARGIGVEDIMTPTRRTPHKMTRFARVKGTTVTYPKRGTRRAGRPK